MSTIGVFGDLKTQAKRPGPASYDIQAGRELGNHKNFHFSSAARQTSLDATTNERIQRETRFLEQTQVQCKGDTIDCFMSEQQQIHAERQKMPLAQQKAPTSPDVAYAAFMKNLSSTPWLISGNVFPSANRSPSLTKSSAAIKQSGVVPIERSHHHQPNEFSEMVAASARMGFKLHGPR
mmetsp:Transcript_47091/g.102273  ORF Transcript_47091/g.102273 Transcript_47091/m.102273 type:complete len:179 (-) Transcript_47091:492-1028(-)